MVLWVGGGGGGGGGGGLREGGIALEGGFGVVGRRWLGDKDGDAGGGEEPMHALEA